jgi:hypothetical protein
LFSGIFGAHHLNPTTLQIFASFGCMTISILADRRQRLAEEDHPGVEDILHDRRQRAPVAVVGRDHDLLDAAILA